MANAGVDGVVGAAVPQIMPWDDTTDALPAEIPALHLALTFSPGEVHAVGGLHLFHANHVPPAPPQPPPQAFVNRP